jgi:hypothetical protein
VSGAILRTERSAQRRLWATDRHERNPATGEAVKIKASKKAEFRAAKELKLAVQGSEREFFASCLKEPDAWRAAPFIDIRKNQ